MNEFEIHQMRDHVRDLVKAPGWRYVRSYLQEITDEALLDLRGCLASNETKGALATRWQQRDSMLKALDTFIEEATALPAEENETNEHTGYPISA